MQEYDSFAYLQAEERNNQELSESNIFLLSHSNINSGYFQNQSVPQLQSLSEKYIEFKDDEPTKDKEDKDPKSSEQTAEPSSKIAFTVASEDKYRRAFQGSKDDTVELNINFKTLLVQYFRELIYLKELNNSQIQHVEEFAKRIPSFSSLTQFYIDKAENEKVRRLCLQFLQSSDCIKRILSGRCRTKTKLMMIKFVEKMRANLFSRNAIKWKQRVPPQIPSFSKKDI